MRRLALLLLASPLLLACSDDDFGTDLKLPDRSVVQDLASTDSAVGDMAVPQDATLDLTAVDDLAGSDQSSPMDQAAVDQAAD